jgi:hypothetical protein
MTRALSTRLQLRTDGAGRPLVLLVTPGQRHADLAMTLCGQTPGRYVVMSSGVVKPFRASQV